LLTVILFFGLDFPCDKPQLELIVRIATLKKVLKIAN
jgi:hypothetical protein